MRKQFLASVKVCKTSLVALACASVLGGCSNSGEMKNPNPTDEARQIMKNALLATSKVGKPFELDGCSVQVYEVNIAYPSQRFNQQISLATANCPTAAVSAIHQNCGKGCEHDSLRVEPHNQIESDKAKEEELAKAHQRNALEFKKQQLQKELGELSSQLEELK